MQDEIEITLSAAIRTSVLSGRERIAGLELVHLARIYDRLGVVPGLIELSAI
jgi:hypothetical protein